MRECGGEWSVNSPYEEVNFEHFLLQNERIEVIVIIPMEWDIRSKNWKQVSEEPKNLWAILAILRSNAVKCKSIFSFFFGSFRALYRNRCIISHSNSYSKTTQNKMLIQDRYSLRIKKHQFVKFIKIKDYFANISLFVPSDNVWNKRIQNCCNSIIANTNNL